MKLHCKYVYSLPAAASMALVAESVAQDLPLVVPPGAGPADPAAPWEQRNLAQGVHRASFQEPVAADSQNWPRMDNKRKYSLLKIQILLMLYKQHCLSETE